MPSGSCAYSDLLTPWSLSPTSAPRPSEPLAHRGEILDRVDLPREVVEAGAALLRPGRLRADREQSEIVVVLGLGGAHEDRRAVAELADDHEAERLLVEGGARAGRRARRALHD